MPLEITDDYADSDFARRQTGLLFNLPAPESGQEQLPAGISLCMIVKNEERFLRECIASVRDVVDEIIVVDTGSTDATVEIAQSFGARVEHREWRNDFAWARNEALAFATRRWTLVLDADEEVTAESLPALRALRETPAALTGVYLQIRNAVEDESGGGATMTHQLPRIFPTSPRLRFRNVIHESVALDGTEEFPAVVSPIVILHKGYTREMLDGRNKEVRNKALLERAIAEQGDSQFSWFNFGTSAIAAGDIDAGIDALEKMFSFPGPSRAFHGVAFTQLAIAYAESKHDYERAIDVLERGLALFPDYPSLLFTRGFVLSLQEKYDEARDWYVRSINATPDARRYFMIDEEIRIWKAPVNIASTFIKENRHEEAAEWLERALRNKPDSAALRGAAASLYEKLGRYYDAERLLRDNAKDNSGATSALANFLLRRGRFDDAFAALDRGTGEPVDAESYLTLLLDVARRAASPADRERFARRALERAPGHGAALALLDEHYAACGDDERRAKLRAGELTAPMRHPADYARRSFRLLEEGRIADALEVARAGLALDPGNGALGYNAALAAARLGRDDEALEFLAALRPHDAVATAGLALRAEIGRRGGNYDDAVAALTQAQALPNRDEATLRAAAVALATALIDAGRLDAAGKLAELVLA